MPHVVLPLWFDHYNMASLVEDLEVGIWGCRLGAPEWTAECLAAAISSIVQDSDKSRSIRANAERISQVARKSLGRDGAAQIIANLAASGRA